jgi:hypothetical protein
MAAARPQQPRITSVYLQGIDNAEIINNVHSRGAPWSPSIPDKPVAHRGTRRTLPDAGSHDAKAAAGSGSGGGAQRVGHPGGRAVEWSGAVGEDDASRFLRLTAHGDDLDAVG